MLSFNLCNRINLYYDNLRCVLNFGTQLVERVKGKKNSDPSVDKVLCRIYNLYAI